VSAVKETRVFLVVRHDRHTDDEITAHATRASADAAVEEFKTRYGNVYQWSEESARGWERLVNSDHDDGPSVHIETTIIHP
jgi:hypothetical protein